MPEPGLGDIYEARARIASAVRRTPIERSLWLSELTGHDVYLKLENWQRTRSFKLRGAFNAVASLPEAVRARGLVTASAGNHGQAVALAARELGAPATIFVPTDGSVTKKARIRAFGAQLNEEHPTYDDAAVAAEAYAQRIGAAYVHAFSDPKVIAGQGTIGIEILEDLPSLHTIVVPVGGGGLIAGVGTAIKAAAPAVRVIGVQSTQTRAMYDAFEAGRVTPTDIGPTLADGLAGCVDDCSYQRAVRVVDRMLLVDEQALPAAIRSLYHFDGVIVEGAAAVTAAAIMQNVVRLEGPTVLVVTGGNIDAERFANILASK